jgi:hypothetical protein
MGMLAGRGQLRKGGGIRSGVGQLRCRSAHTARAIKHAAARSVTLIS